MAVRSGDLVGNILTADATPLSVPLYRMVTSNTTAAFNATVVAVADDGTSASWFMTGLAQRDGGTARLIGSATLTTNPRDLSAVGWTVALDAQDDTVIAVLKGAQGTNISWTLSSDVILTP